MWNSPYCRKTYGHSLLINPWGKILSKCYSKPKIPIKINLSEVSEARKKYHHLIMTKPKSLLDGIGSISITKKYYDDWSENMIKLWISGNIKHLKRVLFY